MRIPGMAMAAMLSFALHAQSPRAYENAAQNALDSRDYYSAMQYYGKVLEMEPSRLDVSYRYADAARQFGAFSKAETYFEKTIREDQFRSFPDASFQLASVKKNLGKYDEAIQLYEQYNAESKPNVALKRKAEVDVVQCEWAMEKTLQPDASITVQPLSEFGFNTLEADFGAIQYGNNCYFSSFKYEDWGDKHVPKRPIVRVMVATDGCDPVPAFFNDSKRHTAHAAFSPDTSVLVFNKCDYTTDTEIQCGLYFTRKTATGWTIPVPLPDCINQEGFTATEPNVATMGDGYYTLFYASDVPGGKGGLDIWKVRFSAVGNFDKPENLSDLNTAQNDITPFYDASQKMLFFSTNGRWSLGGYDVYQSPLKNGKWLDPDHLDVPINSSFDDVYFTIQGEKAAYLTSNRSASMKLDDDCCYDVYKVEYLPLQLTASTFSTLTERPLDGVTYSIREIKDTTVNSRHSGADSSMNFQLLRQKQYMVIATKPYYEPDTVWVSTATFPENRQFVEKLYLEPRFQLKVQSFHQWTKEPLTGVQFRLLEPAKQVAENHTTGLESNETNILFKGKRLFTIIAEKQGFLSDTVQITESELYALVAGSTLTKSLFLTPATMHAYLPITLYFDNDQPNPRTRATTTLMTYDETVAQYLNRRQVFIDGYTVNLTGEAKKDAEEKLGRFFDYEVKGGQVKLETFASNLSLFLAGGSNLNIMVKAFASPLANADYNMALTQRRIASVRNFFRKYNNGIFESYIRSGQLQVSMLPLGETQADVRVSDDSKNKRLSIYSPEASKERRAEILEVRIFKN
jgi:hypothetical protein